MNIIITAASRGIGFDTALELAKDPDNQVFALARSVEKLKKLVAVSEESTGHGNLKLLKFDITDLQLPKVVALANSLKKVDILINNAGYLVNKPFEELSNEDWHEMFEVNLFGVARLTKLLIPYLEKSQKSHVVNIGSMGGVQGSSKFPGLSAYSASKAALANLTECLAEEMKDRNITFNCLALGAIQTEMLAEAFPGFQAPVQSEEIARFIAHFCTEGHYFQNGKIIPVSVSTP